MHFGLKVPADRGVSLCDVHYALCAMHCASSIALGRQHHRVTIAIKRQHATQISRDDRIDHVL